jgi:hypothetical protein
MLRFAFMSLALALPLGSPHAVWAQGVGTVLRAGAGVDSQGGLVFGGQIALVDFGASSSVEMALAAFEGRLVEDYSGEEPGPIVAIQHDYHEDTRARGAGLIGSLLIGHGPRDSRGPYIALGLGIGALDVDWRVESPTARDLGPARPTGGSMREEHGLLPGGLGNVGLGFRLHRRLDLRAQALTLMAPSTDARENLKLLTVFTLTAGVGS